jgi:hypothetical protein
MRASTVMLLAIGFSVVGRWANNQKVTATAVAEGMFALVVITMLDHGKTEPVAKGFAWLFFVAVLLGNNSPLTGLSKLGAKNASATGSAVKIVGV